MNEKINLESDIWAHLQFFLHFHEYSNFFLYHLGLQSIFRQTKRTTVQVSIGV